MSTKSISRPAPPIPPLEQGDHLTRDEFERRYDAMPHGTKAELIEGVVHMHAAARFEQHGVPHADLIWWLNHYRVFTPGVRVGDNTTVRLDLDNEPQPDALMIVLPQNGGQALIDADGYIEGAPEMVAEVAASSAGIDLHQKFRVYRRNQVREYIVWRVFDEAMDWFVLRGTEYVPLTPLAQSGVGPILTSETFPGLWLDADAMIRSDLAAVLTTLQRGLASPEHAAFAAKLQRV